MVEANAIGPGLDVSLKQPLPFEDDFHLNYIECLDYKDNVQATGRINDWISENTNETIPNFLALDELDKDNLGLVLTAALAFEAKWMCEFDPENTKVEDFTRLDGSVVRTPMMFNTVTFPHREKDRTQTILIPYLYSTIEMVVVLPKPESFEEVEKN